jgi:exo-1,4-beta-D-glucosaminidase
VGNATWNYHVGRAGSVFDNTDVYSKALSQRYGTTTSAADYSKKSEVMNYENTRSFFEAWSARQNTQSFGSIWWMQNNAWPSLHWNLYDYYFKPGGSFYGTRKATESLHIAYDYFTRNVYVVNSTLAARTGLTATATVLNIPDLAQKYTTSIPVSAPANASASVLTLPAVAGLTSTYFVRLQLKDAGGATVSDNLYWYSTTPDALGNKSNWYSTAVKTYANLSGLNSLPSNTGVTTAVSRSVAGGQETVTITLTNTSPTNIAFFLRPEVTAGNGGTEVVPVSYTDNYLSLFPGESRQITAAYATADLGGLPAYLRVRGYNTPTASLPVP